MQLQDFSGAFAVHLCAGVAGRRKGQEVLGGMSKPALSRATACNGFRLERGYIGASGSPASTAVLPFLWSAINDP